MVPQTDGPIGKFDEYWTVQNLARWAGTPPSVLAHLLKQVVVRNQPQVKMLLLRHPNLPAHARAAGTE